MAEYNGVHVQEYRVRGEEYVRLWWYTGEGSRRETASLGRRDALTKARINRRRSKKEKELALQPGRIGAGESPTLSAWVDEYLRMREKEWSDASYNLAEHSLSWLKDFLGENKRIDSITRADAAKFRQWMANQPGQSKDEDVKHV